MTAANGTNGPVHQGNGLNIDAPRFEGVTRPYTPADVAKLQGSMKIEYTLANEGAKKLWVRTRSSD
jgi:isocitrate lyase